MPFFVLQVGDFEALELPNSEAEDISLKKALLSKELKTVTFTVSIHTGPTAALWGCGSETRRSLVAQKPPGHLADGCKCGLFSHLPLEISLPGHTFSAPSSHLRAHCYSVNTFKTQDAIHESKQFGFCSETSQESSFHSQSLW